MRSKTVVPIGQGCRAMRFDDKLTTTLKSGCCAEHFWLYLNICLGCGDKFHTSRPHTITCSDRCRQRLSRSRRFDKVFQTVMDFAGGVR